MSGCVSCGGVGEALSSCGVLVFCFNFVVTDAALLRGDKMCGCVSVCNAHVNPFVVCFVCFLCLVSLWGFTLVDVGIGYKT